MCLPKVRGGQRCYRHAQKSWAKAYERLLVGEQTGPSQKVIAACQSTQTQPPALLDAVWFAVDRSVGEVPM